MICHVSDLEPPVPGGSVFGGFIHPPLGTRHLLSHPPNWKPSRRPSTKSAKTPARHLQNAATLALEGGTEGEKGQLGFGGCFALICNTDDKCSTITIPNVRPNIECLLCAKHVACIISFNSHASCQEARRPACRAVQPVELEGLGSDLFLHLFYMGPCYRTSVPQFPPL